jgi:hypothetical protein
MITETDLPAETFKDYHGGRNAKKALEYIEGEFRKQAPPKKEKEIAVETISARYSREVRIAFEKVKESVYGQNKAELLARFRELHALRAQRVAFINKARSRPPPPPPLRLRCCCTRC